MLFCFNRRNLSAGVVMLAETSTSRPPLLRLGKTVRPQTGWETGFLDQEIARGGKGFGADAPRRTSRPPAGILRQPVHRLGDPLQRFPDRGFSQCPNCRFAVGDYVTSQVMKTNSLILIVGSVLMLGAVREEIGRASCRGKG